MLRLFFKILFIPVEVAGADKIDTGRTYLFMSNHTSMFDIPLLEAYIPNYVRIQYLSVLELRDCVREKILSLVEVPKF